mmetsp:Transcript_23961/g.66555  ORF Transcript_23961/g.66555 Transcript_23961/m.66555 type:complete len:438 (-) Transcript_23961:452-1765(-)|eukprot:CAMPEP_0117676304 /NCGR_PEP_ID=MMETSP0804-20121206/16088_1 /TAXON_ID=1074897 /ORGANISM="Tetraselmis astigmatica, Strain CCMP880" /LENGTH=437 /DNA_ID=CAMNT_0005485407 /DNA_START=19 /DNA_END=1332 /DNA_ORIENTATION=-
MRTLARDHIFPTRRIIVAWAGALVLVVCLAQLLSRAADLGIVSPIIFSGHRETDSQARESNTGPSLTIDENSELRYSSADGTGGVSVVRFKPAFHIACPAACSKYVSPAAAAVARPAGGTEHRSPRNDAREKRRDYVENHAKRVFGYMQDTAGYAAALLTAEQHRLGIFGAAGEVGVHHGLFFLAIALFADRDRERLFAIDVFEDQGKNVDRSGKGDFEKFSENLAKFGLQPVVVQTGRRPNVETSSRRDDVPTSSLNTKPAEVAADLLVRPVATFRSASNEVHPAHLCDALSSPIRMASIDGGHTGNITYHDLTLFNCALAEGGILWIDDFSHSYWPGVQDGTSRFFHLHPNNRLAPFALISNKLGVTTASHQQAFYDVVASDRSWQHAVGKDKVKQNMYGWPVAVFDRKPVSDPEIMKQSWLKLADQLEPRLAPA